MQHLPQYQLIDRNVSTDRGTTAPYAVVPKHLSPPVDQFEPPAASLFAVNMPFLNPFGKYDKDNFPDVYVPLHEAPRHPSVVATNIDRIRMSVSESSDKKLEEASEEPPALTLASLREEIDADVAASGHDSAYDRKSKVINKAIQDIGMGRYQWQLFVLCGFGWLADKYVPFARPRNSSL